MAESPRQLRDYQTEAVDAVMEAWANDTRFTAVVLPTGTGKSTVIGTLAARSARMGLRVAMLAHRAELLDQMAGTVAACDPGLDPVGIVRADRDEHDRQIVAASFQTLVNDRRHAALGERRVILVDETHHVTADTYRQVVEDFGPDTFGCGFTATLRREDGKALRSIIHSVAFERNLRWAIEAKHLVRPRGITVKIPTLDLGKVKTTAGDFQNAQLAEVMEAETPHIVDAILRHCSDRKPIIFAASVDAAHAIAEALSLRGMRSEAVTGAMSYEMRQPIYNRFAGGQNITQALVTVQVLTEGADFPMCDAVVIARPTQSQNMYSQMVGRALRLYPGKTDALVLDLVGTSRVLKLVTVSSLDAGIERKTVDPDGQELPPEDDEAVIEPAGAKAPKAKRFGPIDTIGIDLLGEDETGINWMGTRKGVPFCIPPESPDAWFLWKVGYDKDEELYRVGVMSVKGDKLGGWIEGGKPVPLDIAIAVAEDSILESGYAFPLRAASWRKTAKPSDAQIKYAKGLGIKDADKMTKARVADEISIAVVSRRLDGAR